MGLCLVSCSLGDFRICEGHVSSVGILAYQFDEHFGIDFRVPVCCHSAVRRGDAISVGRKKDVGYNPRFAIISKIGSCNNGLQDTRSSLHNDTGVSIHSRIGLSSSFPASILETMLFLVNSFVDVRDDFPLLLPINQSIRSIHHQPSIRACPKHPPHHPPPQP
jgi:hypothetical protein